MKKVGILALQGDFEAHAKAIERAGGRAIEVRSRAEMAACDGLIIPAARAPPCSSCSNTKISLEPLRAFGEKSRFTGPARARFCWRRK